MTSSFKLRPFDGTAVTFTMREIHAPAREFKSQYHDAEEAAGACLTPARRRPASSCAIPKKIIAAYAGHRLAA